LCRTTPEAAHLLQPLEDCINTRFIPTLTGRETPNNTTRDLLALPAHLGGLKLLAIIDLTKLGKLEYQASSSISSPLYTLISEQFNDYNYECIAAQLSAKSDVIRQKCESEKKAATALRSAFPKLMKRVIELAQEKGASSWLRTLPLEKFGFSLHKSAFRDAIALRYGWSPLNNSLCLWHFFLSSTCLILPQRRISYSKA